MGVNAHTNNSFLTQSITLDCLQKVQLLLLCCKQNSKPPNKLQKPEVLQISVIGSQNETADSLHNFELYYVLLLHIQQKNSTNITNELEQRC